MLNLIFFLFVLILFTLAGRRVVRISKTGARLGLFTIAVVATVIFTLGLFSFNYKEFDAPVIIVLLIATAALGVFFATRKLW